MSSGVASAISFMLIIISQILTLNAGQPDLKHGALAIKGNKIAAFGPVERIRKRFPGNLQLCLPNSILMPGLVNVHTHLELPSLLDAVRAKAFPDWVLNLIKRKKELSVSNYAAAARENIAFLIHTGTTTVGEICTHDVSPGILEASGLRSVIYREIISMDPSSPGPSVPALIARPSSALVRSGLSPHSPYTVSEPTLREIKKIAARRRTFLSMHVAESKDEIRLLQREKSGLAKLYHDVGWKTDWAPTADSPFLYLAKLGLLNHHFLAVHAVQATDRDITIIKKTRAAIAHCPRSNHETGVGRMPLKRVLNAGITVGLGTDSLASSPSLNMWDEMRYAYQLHRRDGVTAQDIFELATTRGAKALGLANEIGSLAPGKKADIIAVPLPSRNTGNIYSDLLRETKTCIMSMVNGKILYKI